MTNVKPLGDNVLVKPLEEAQMTNSGIIIPDTVNKEKPMRGEVVAIGDGKEGNTLDGVSTGDVVIFTKYAPTEIKIEGQEFYILGFDSVLAVEK